LGRLKRATWKNASAAENPWEEGRRGGGRGMRMLIVRNLDMDMDMDIDIDMVKRVKKSPRGYPRVQGVPR
jgi:hypothetical protein